MVIPTVPLQSQSNLDLTKIQESEADYRMREARYREPLWLAFLLASKSHLNVSKHHIDTHPIPKTLEPQIDGPRRKRREYKGLKHSPSTSKVARTGSLGGDI